MENLTAREIYGKRVSFRKRKQRGVGVVYGVDKVLKEKNGLQSGTKDIFHIRCDDGELFQMEAKHIKLLNNGEEKEIRN